MGLEGKTLQSLDKILEDKGLEDGQTISEYILAKAEIHLRNGRSHYLVDGLSDEKRYFKDIEEESRKIGSHFYKKGLRKGDIVIYVSNTQIKQSILMLGVWRANGVVRSLYADDEPGTLLEKVMESKARWMFCDPDQVSVCLDLAGKVGWPIEAIVSGGDLDKGLSSAVSFQEYLQDDGSALPPITTTQLDLALILPTSGTTGKSKGAAITHRGFLIQSIALANLPWTYPKPNLIASKGTHISGTMVPWSILIAGCTTVVLPKVTKENVIRTVDKYKPGSVFAFPTFLTALTSSDADGFDVSSLEFVVVGGCTISPALKETYRSLPNVRDVVSLYGLTEGVNQCTSADMVSNLPALGNYEDISDRSIGKPFAGTLIEIRDLESLEPLGPHKEGELCVKGEHVFSGYYLNPVGTKEAFTEDGWFRTGDVGYYDGNGYVYLVDRKKDIFKFRGNHVSPSEIEEIILRHPSVNEVCVVSVTDPNEEGELPRAFVTIKNQIENDKTVESLGQQIETFANDQLANYKHLRGGLYIIKELPKGKTGKVTRNLVAQLKPVFG